MITVEVGKPETHRNWEAPPLPQAAHDELVSIGGLNIYNQPNLVFAWGQTRMQFRMNKERLLYVDTRIPAVEHKRFTFKKLLYVKREKVHLRTDQGTGEMFFEDKEIPVYDIL